MLLIITALSVLSCGQGVQSGEQKEENEIQVVVESQRENPKKKNDLQSEGFKGKVKSVRTIKYNATEKFGEIQTKNVNWKGGQKIVYNQQGNEIEMYLYDFEGNMSRKYDYEYDDTGNKTAKFEYSSDEQLLNKRTYKYDDRGNQIEESWSDSSGNLVGKYTYKYDDKGNKIEECSYESDGSLMEKTIHKYDDRDNVTKISVYDSYGDLDETITIEYNDQGYFTEVIVYDSDRDFQKKTFRYEYDTYRNWTKRVEYSDGKADSIIEREIVYYD